MISKQQREGIIKELGKQFAQASGYDVNNAGIKQWEVCVDALIKAVEGIVQAELNEPEEPEPA